MHIVRPRTALVLAVAVLSVISALPANAVAAGASPRSAAVPASAPTLSPSPTITGTVKVGATLSATPGRWAPGAVTFAYVWYANDVRIVGQTSAQFTLRPADAGKRITLTLTGTVKNRAPVARSSSPTGPVAASTSAALTASAAPTITGNPAAGGTLTASTGAWGPGSVAFSYQWRRNGRIIPGATLAAYRITTADSGSMLSVTLSGSRPGSASTIRTSDARRIVPSSPPRDVVAILGQSNAQGSGWPADPSIDVTVRGVDQLAGSGPSAGRVIAATEPLAHVTTFAGRVGPGSRFGRFLLMDAAPDRAVLLVPAAQGSTSLTGDAQFSWDPSNTTAATNLYTRAIGQIDAALAQHPGNRLVAIIWAQGESDATRTDGDTYRTKLLSVVDGLRSRYGQVPILIGGMVPEWIAQAAPRQAIDAAHRAVAAARPLVAYVPGVPGHNQEGALHYDAVGARLMAERYYGSWLGLLSR